MELSKTFRELLCELALEAAECTTEEHTKIVEEKVNIVDRLMTAYEKDLGL